MRHLGKTPPFRAPDGEVMRGSIAEVSYSPARRVRSVGDGSGREPRQPTDDSAARRAGAQRDALFRLFNAPLERIFTIVHWDQRGAGKSFDRNIPRSSMTVEQVHPRSRRVGRGRLQAARQDAGRNLRPLLGLGSRSSLCRALPQKVAAYVGSGQYGDAAAGEAASYAYGLAEAERCDNRRALKKLRDIGSPPHTAKQLLTERTWVARLEGSMRPRAWRNLARVALGVRESSIADLPRLMRGFRFSLDACGRRRRGSTSSTLAPTLDMPVFFFLGRKDHWVPPEVSVAYFEALEEPSKKLVWFEESGHEPFADEPAEFNAAMAELVRPVMPSEQPAGTG